MAAKRKRKKSKNPTAKRSHAKRSHAKRKTKANPKRSHAKRSHKAHRPRRSNPKRSHAKRSHARRRPRRANPSRKRAHARRGRRRNPGLPVWLAVILASGLGLVTYAVGTDGSFALTQRTDATLQTLDRNRAIVSGVLTVGGVALAAFAKPDSIVQILLGCGVAAGGLASLGGTQVSNALGHLIDKHNPDGSLQTAQPAAVAGAPAAKALTGVFDPSGNQRLGAVYGQGGSQQLGAVFGSFGNQQLGSMYDDGADYFGG